MKEIFFFIFENSMKKTPKIIYDTNFGFLLLCKENFLSTLYQAYVYIYIWCMLNIEVTVSLSLIFGDKIKNAKKKKKKKLRNLALK